MRYCTLLLLGLICSSQAQVNDPWSSRDCGWSNINAMEDVEDPLSNKFGGDYQKSQYAEFPWVVALISKYTLLPFGGGSIIHPTVVLTAASKAMETRKNDITVRAGEWDIQNEETYANQDRDVSKIIKHPKFPKCTGNNNVALLILKTAFNYEPSIGIACLSPTATPDGVTCYGAGWGMLPRGHKKYTNQLKKVILPTVNRLQCTSSLRRVLNNPYYDLPSTIICAGGSVDQDLCIGDGGSPLMCPAADAERYTVAGITSAGVDCGLAVPGLYTGISFVYNWIKMNMEREGLSTEYFTIKMMK